ncbi:receptor expression-enhancing protein 2-like isoform X2 [Venturia canescens]|uniref:receptor expression-enhancing protein 2-like isoform X2 n=1 Tax=Venturia canescens TaxID=32260 RepID=UPI001C9C4279|nr:receptor expression-enhancing protein 2-like isoform X2 [Venturia canescens]
MISSIVSRLVILVFGTLYPAYASYKAVRTKNVKEYVKWMMYWIVFALFTCAETFTDVFFSFWFPFYYEIKIILVLWLLSPATKGSSILYRRFVHPALSRREAEIDDALARATEQGYTAVLHLGTRGVNYATTVLMQTAIKGGGGLVQQLKKSYSLSDLTGEKEDENRNTSSMRDETDMEEPRRRENPGRRGYSPRRTQSSSNRVEMYFSEVDVDVRQPRPRDPVASLTNIRSSDDISSGYSSGEALQTNRVTSQVDSLLRTASVGARTRTRPRSATTKKIPEVGEDEQTSEISSFPDLSLFPQPLPLLTARQALELILLLSQVNPSDNKDVCENLAPSLITVNAEGNSKDAAESPPVDFAIEKIADEIPEENMSVTNAENVLESPKQKESNNQEFLTDIEPEDKKIMAPLPTEEIMVDNDTLITNDNHICQDKLEELKITSFATLPRSKKPTKKKVP